MEKLEETEAKSQIKIIVAFWLPGGKCTIMAQYSSNTQQFGGIKILFLASYIFFTVFVFRMDWKDLAGYLHLMDSFLINLRYLLFLPVFCQR